MADPQPVPQEQSLDELIAALTKSLNRPPPSFPEPKRLSLGERIGYGIAGALNPQIFQGVVVPLIQERRLHQYRQYEAQREIHQENIGRLFQLLNVVQQERAARALAGEREADNLRSDLQLKLNVLREEREASEARYRQLEKTLEREREAAGRKQAANIAGERIEQTGPGDVTGGLYPRLNTMIDHLRAIPNNPNAATLATTLEQHASGLVGLRDSILSGQMVFDQAGQTQVENAIRSAEQDLNSATSLLTAEQQRIASEKARREPTRLDSDYLHEKESLVYHLLVGKHLAKEGYGGPFMTAATKYLGRFLPGSVRPKDVDKQLQLIAARGTIYGLTAPPRYGANQALGELERARGTILSDASSEIEYIKAIDTFLPQTIGQLLDIDAMKDWPEGPSRLAGAVRTLQGNALELDNLGKLLADGYVITEVYLEEGTVRLYNSKLREFVTISP